jgi:hypothetical protein
MQSALVIVLGAGTMITSAIAALNWFRSASPPPESLKDPDVSISDSPEVYTIAGRVEMDGIRRALQASARFNRIAAMWTGISALLSAATTLVGIAS